MPRPTDYTEELAIKICDRLSDGRSLRSVCDDEDMPDKSTVFRWLAKIEPFRDQYEIAVEARADAHVEEILDIADDGTNDWMQTHGENNEGWRQNGEAIQRSRLRVDARKWIASKLKPKKYGDKIAVGGDADNPLAFTLKFGSDAGAHLPETETLPKTE